MWLGFLIDMNNPKRYSYPRTIYIDNYSKSYRYLTYEPLDSITSTLKNIVKLTPMKIFDISNSSVELSFERKTSDLLSSQIMLSYLLPNNFIDYGNEFKPGIRGYKFGFEEKVYLRKSSPIGPYLGFEINHLKSRYNELVSFGSGLDSVHHYNAYSDSINIIKRTTSLNFKIGYQEISGRFSFDFYCGIGARYKNVLHLNRINTDDQMSMPKDFNFYYITNREGKYWVIVLLLNIRIGWLF
jgi:hypothetical protein